MVVTPVGRAFHCPRCGSAARTMLPTRSDRVSARFPSRTIPGRGGWTQKPLDWSGLFCSPGAPTVDVKPTTAVIQRYLDALPEDATAEPVVRELLERAV